MSGKVTITFSAAGLQPPIHVVTSLSSPPWVILEMHPASETESGENLFTRTFDGVAIGSYQYKIRIGEDHWVLDERQQITTDASGNQNNLVHVTETAGDNDNTSDTVINDSDDVASDAEDHVEPGTPDQQAAPLLRHEQHKDEPPRSPLRRKSTEPLEIIQEESSTRESSADNSHEQSVDEESDAEDESDQVPPLDHELSASAFDASSSDSNDTVDENFEYNVEQATGLDTYPRYELRDAPTFGYEHVRGPEVARFSFEQTSGAPSMHSSEPPVDEDAPTLLHERLNGEDDDFHAPLLVHEQLGGIPTPESSDGYSFGGGSLNEDGHGSFNYGVEFGTPAYPGLRSTFLTRTGTHSELPHALPRSDDEDPNLNDPSLQPFPTSRREILERVGTIRTQLPQDETVESPAHSPFVASQACSSVDLPSAELGPVASQISLNAVEEEDDDTGGLPSPPQESSAAKDAHALRMRQYGGCPGPVDSHGNPTKPAQVSPPMPPNTISSQGNDGAQDGPRVWSDLYETVATPTRVLTSFTSPHAAAAGVETWVTRIPSDAGSAPPPTDDSNRTRLAAQDSSDSMAILPCPPQTVNRDPYGNEQMEHKTFEVNRSYPYMGGNNPPKTLMQKAINDVVAGFDWVCGCCGSCGPQARTAQGFMALIVAGAAYYAYGYLQR